MVMAVRRLYCGKDPIAAVLGKIKGLEDRPGGVLGKIEGEPFEDNFWGERKPFSPSTWARIVHVVQFFRGNFKFFGILLQLHTSSDAKYLICVPMNKLSTSVRPENYENIQSGWLILPLPFSLIPLQRQVYFCILTNVFLVQKYTCKGVAKSFPKN
ncbi:hypothetical protein RHGRI_007673 [Rhododendron griersonianum]|uniref:Uncharacterized protein n=1 Tax=Rhododendron griersonianum TaxID=479676 RepID=A0AAV6KXM8_9ERIC|nr:hypothetical protein RHGRI_007673 [Rhododendron griersonianum]